MVCRILIAILFLGTNVFILFVERSGFITSNLSDGAATLAVVAGILEVLINAYYGGGLTMFLASKPALPFDSALDGIAEHSDSWTLLLGNGDEGMIGTNLDINLHPKLKEADDRFTSEEFIQTQRWGFVD